jgi:secernin
MMCDTVVALGKATADGSVLFAKNSDRDPNEAQELVIFPAADHTKDSPLQCTYITIPQVKHTHRVLLARPFWLWGAEMGANEHGVVIGNEAVFTKVPHEKKPGLIGMDLLRLGLERAENARDALDVIVELLEAFGQGGNCGFSHPFYYDNSFIIADHTEAWVLETAGRHWAAEKVESIRTISNALTIGSRFDLVSKDLVNYALQRGWCKKVQDFDFARCYSDLIYTRGGAGAPRQVCTTNLLQKEHGKLTLESFFALLRTHNVPVRKGVGAQANFSSSESAGWTPDRAILGAQVCMHTGWGPVRESNSAGSLVARLNGTDEYWVTGTSTPCTGIFKPVWIDAGLPDLGPSPAGTYDDRSLWWRHEILHREVLRDFPRRLAAYAESRDSLEKKFLLDAQPARIQSSEKRLDYSAACFEQACKASEGWLAAVRAEAPKRVPRFYYRLAWNNVNRRANMQNLTDLPPKRK